MYKSSPMQGNFSFKSGAIFETNQSFQNFDDFAPRRWMQSSDWLHKLALGAERNSSLYARTSSFLTSKFVPVDQVRIHVLFALIHVSLNHASITSQMLSGAPSKSWRPTSTQNEPSDFRDGNFARVIFNLSIITRVLLRDKPSKFFPPQ